MKAKFLTSASHRGVPGFPVNLDGEKATAKGLAIVERARLAMNTANEYERLRQVLATAPSRQVRRAAQAELKAFMRKRGLTVPVVAPFKPKESRIYRVADETTGQVYCLSRRWAEYREERDNSRSVAVETEADKKQRILAKYGVKRSDAPPVL